MNIGKFLRRAAAVFGCLLLCGCTHTQEDKAGADLITAAREDYCSLDSARVIMTNENTGEVEQTFTFKYDEKDVLMFSYYGKSENSEYAQYNNGAECFTYENGEYSHTDRGDSDFVKYTRAATHPQADSGLLIYEPSSITEDTLTKLDDGCTEVLHVYDAEAIGASVESGEVTGFSVRYVFDEDNSLLYFTETTTANENGEEIIYPYRVEITEQNCVGDIENTTDAFRE